MRKIPRTLLTLAERFRTPLICIFICILWVLLLPHAGFLAPLLHCVRFSTAALPVFILSALFFVLRPKWKPVLFGIVLVWFGLFFLENWSIGTDNLCTAKILIPIGDSAGYYFEAGRVAHGHLCTQWAAAHVISHALFGALTLLTGQNLLLTHVLVALLGVIALCLCAEQVNASTGSVAATVLLVSCGLMYSSSLGTFSSELYGLSAGLLGTALLLAGIRRKDMPSQLMGLFALGIALVARPGAFFVLPLIGLALATLQPTWRKKGLLLGAAVIAVGASLLINAAVTKLLCEPATTTMGMDFWHHFNGMLMGKGWSASIATCTAEEARAAALKAVSDNPSLLLKVSWKAMVFFFQQHVAFAFLPYWAARTMEWLFAAGFVTCVVFIRKPLNRVLIAAAIGIMLSLPFAPPWDAGVRTYTATMPLQLLIAVRFLSIPEGFLRKWIARKFEKRRTVADHQPNPGTHPAWGTFLAILAVGILLPIAETHTPLHFAKQQSYYWDGHMHVRLIPGTYLRIVPNDSITHSYVPTVRQEDFIRPMHGFHYLYMADDTAVYSRMPTGVLVTRSDAMGIVFVIKDDFGKKLPASIDANATIVPLKGDGVVFDNRLGIDTGKVTTLLNSVYMPWLEGYHYFYRYQAILGCIDIENIQEDGTVRMHTENYGVLTSSEKQFPLFTRNADGKTLRMDTEKGTMTEVTGTP